MARSKTETLLAEARTQPAPEVVLTENPYLACFARNWCGTIAGTIERCAQDGFPITRETGGRYLRDPRFITYTQLASPLKPGEGIWTVDDIKRFLTRVASGIEPERYDLIIVKEPILITDDDYDHDLEGEQWRKVEKHVPIYPGMRDRTKAVELLGKTQAAFTDNVNVQGQFSIVGLLDADLKPVHDVHAQVVDRLTQVVDIDEEGQIDLTSLL